MPIPPRKLSERRGSATDRQKSYALLLVREAFAVGYPVEFGLDPVRGRETASMKDVSMLIDRLKKAKAEGWPGSRVSARAVKVSGARKKSPHQLDAEIAEALRSYREPDTGSRVTLTINDTYRPWRELQILAHIDGKEAGYLDLQLTPQGVPYPSMVSVKSAMRRRGIATLLYQEAARLAEDRFGHPLHSDIDRSGSDDAFWQKQVRAGLAECVRKRAPPREVPFDHIVKGRSSCTRYRLAKKAVPR
jgi:hypothetical protein